jgi:hypothetical protein
VRALARAIGDDISPSLVCSLTQSGRRFARDCRLFARTACLVLAVMLCACGQSNTSARSERQGGIGADATSRSGDQLPSGDTACSRTDPAADCDLERLRSAEIEAVLRGATLTHARRPDDGSLAEKFECDGDWVLLGGRATGAVGQFLVRDDLYCSGVPTASQGSCSALFRDPRGRYFSRAESVNGDRPLREVMINRSANGLCAQ